MFTREITERWRGFTNYQGACLKSTSNIQYGRAPPVSLKKKSTSNTNDQFSYEIGKICHGTSLKPWFCYKPLKNRVFAGGHRKIRSICSRTLKALIYSIQLGE